MAHTAQKSCTYQRRRPELTPCYRILQEHLATFVADRDAEGSPLPKHVLDEFDAYMRCGILAHGFTLLKCDACQTEVPIAFSCKHRGFCPSCTAKRATETAVHIGEDLWPTASARQWVFTFPHPLRALMANDREITNLIHQEVHKMVQFFYDNQAHK